MTLRRKALVLSFLLTGVLVPVRIPAETSPDQVSGSRGTAVRIWAASFTPGDILLLSLSGPSSVREVGVNFLNRDLILRPDEEGGPALAFIGLDLGLKPGLQPMRVVFYYKDGSSETALKSFQVKRRTFRLRQIRVPEQFIEPPPEVQERISREARMLAEVYAEVTPRWLGDGRFVAPHQGRMMNNFGERRILNGQKRSVHAGLDIDAAQGDLITASNAGNVVLAADLYFSGNTVILDHGLGVFTVYLHMSKLLVQTGNHAGQGAALGEAGSTGRSAGPHLHWAVKIFDSRVDPQALLGLPLDSR
ncbi:MAG: M23 family metallopeptidase [Candidatus Aminicenantes bacterium]|nr:M23 family metallopeptidase [Candidatus Aminicenantes bacterium]